MCDHCKTFKPLLDGPDRFYEKSAPIIHDITPIQERRSSASDNGCCSWRRSCCDGGCCDRIGNCCSSGSDTTAQVRDKPSTSYGYGYGYGQPAPMTAMPYQMMDAMPERVPCKRQEKKLPMCFGGDCKDDEKCESDGTETPRQSER
ncbi:uncharacterized protein LOC143265609 isoform X2 [Megachile rotundata]|uniref:uncharacterized protein LOC143265609 isoform X2 n=1 Tax=Megachile rotundata TaxID=143995 RepID=UPI003FD1B01E